MKRVEMSMEEERDGSFKIAENLYNSGARPTFIYGVTRGGNYAAGPISEYFKWRYEKENSKLKEDEPMLELITGSVVAHEYDKKNKPGEVLIEGWAPALSRISKDDTMVLCDDCYDTGNTLRTLIKDIELHTPLRKEMSPFTVLGDDQNYRPSGKVFGSIEATMVMAAGNVRIKCPQEIFKPEYFANRKLIVVTHDLKYFLEEKWEESPLSGGLRCLPDAMINVFYCKGKWADGNGPWIQYNRYEMMGLSDEEIWQKYKVKA